eukprot:1158835-Pelagomonas_calceolata.AAC.14
MARCSACLCHRPNRPAKHTSGDLFSPSCRRPWGSGCRRIPAGAAAGAGRPQAADPGCTTQAVRLSAAAGQISGACHVLNRNKCLVLARAGRAAAQCLKIGIHVVGLACKGRSGHCLPS